ncbi:MAG: AmmeMemoRadiSam system protein B [Candidatus Sericytochromatia bacterium]
MIRPAAVAGLFYPAEAEVLRSQIAQYLAQSAALSEPETRLRALVVPHAGYIYSGPVAGTAYRQLECLDQQQHWKILLLGPAHRVPLRGVSVGAFSAYQTPLGQVAVSPLARDMASKLGFVPEADWQEHSLEVQLPFLQQQLASFEIIPIVVGAAQPETLAEFLKAYLDDTTLLVISTDLSHYLTYDQAVATDAVANQAIPAADIETLRQKGDACGLTGVLTLLYLARTLGWKGRFLDYRNSGDTAGSKDRVVGYGAYSFGEAA